MKLIFIRHAQDDEHYRGGWSNTDITAEGIAQAKSLATCIEKCDCRQNISHIITSDLKRALSTAEILSDSLAIPIIKEPMLREINNGKLSDMLNEVASELYPNLFFRTLGMDDHYPDGESPREFYERISTWLESFITDNKNSWQNVLVVTHGGVINILRHITEGIAWNNKNKPYPLPPCGIFTIEID